MYKLSEGTIEMNACIIFDFFRTEHYCIAFTKIKMRNLVVSKVHTQEIKTILEASPSNAKGSSFFVSPDPDNDIVFLSGSTGVIKLDGSRVSLFCMAIFCDDVW